MVALRRLLLSCVLAAVLGGCGREGGPGVYAARGRVESVSPETGQVVIDHEDVPGLMPAMTMNFDVPDPALLARLAPGQAIDFRLEFTGKAYRVVEATVRGEAGAAGSSGPAKADMRELPPAGDPAPPWRLVDQDGNPRALEELRGKTLLLDFIYTNCPGPCPILTGVHVDLWKALDPALREHVRFVSISLDPVRDSPAALRAYRQKRGADVAGADWLFLTGPPEEVAQVVQAYGVGSARQPDGEIAHLVASFLIDAQGRIVQRFVGLEHAVDQLKTDVERVARGSP